MSSCTMESTSTASHPTERRSKYVLGMVVSCVQEHGTARHGTARYSLR